MKLSDIKGDRVFDVIADLVDPIANIAQDSKAAAMFRREKLPEGMTQNAFVLQRVRAALPPLLHGHKQDLAAIMAAVEGVSAQDYLAKLDIVKLAKDFIDLMNDDAFTALFISAQGQDGTSSGSAPETTAAPQA